MSAGWGVVNVGIAAGGLLASGPPPAEPAALLTAERRFHDILLFNLGLNVAYSAVGATMLGASRYGVENVGRWRGFGTALILQGVGLLVLDGIAFWASRGRLSSLLDAGMHLSLQAGPTGAALTLQF
jgi:sulfite exporter TauE/SafE